MADGCVATLDTSALQAAKKHLKAGSTDQTNQVTPYAPGIDPLELAYLFIFDSVQIGTVTAQTQAKDIQNNAIQQNNMIAEEGQQNFVVLQHSQLFSKQIVIPSTGKAYVQYNPKKVASTELTLIETDNQEVSAIRSVLEDQINVLRQNAQVAETNINTTSDDCQQSIQQGGNLMQMLTSLTSQISRI